MIRRPLRALLMWAALPACATGTGSGAPGQPGDDRAVVTVGPEAVATGQAGLAAWIAYGATRAKLYESSNPRRHNRSGDDYAIELGARAALADFWAEAREKADKPNTYLDLLVEIRRAGQLEEYVVTYFAKPGWTVPADALGAFDLPAFQTFAQSRLKDHQPQTLVSVEPAHAPPWPEEPGRTLPDPVALSPKKVPCAASTPRITEALAAWAREEGALDGAALAAGSRAEFARLVDWARGNPEYRHRGVTWVSPVAADLHFLLGFCAVERQDLAAATRALGASVRLNPLSAGPRLELSHVLVLQRKLDEADQQVAGVLASTHDRCELARAWRRRGYILVERGRLEEAWTAYQKSLEHDPGSKIAVDEMVFIAREIQRLGGSEARAFKPYQPPPGSTARQVVTECQGD